jgi:hypothetical protein
MPRYIVIENTPGYLPDDDDPATFEDLEGAIAYLRERVESYCDFLAEGYDYAEDYKSEVWIADDGTEASVSDPRRAHDLGRWFDVSIFEGEL